MVAIDFDLTARDTLAGAGVPAAVLDALPRGWTLYPVLTFTAWGPVLSYRVIWVEELEPVERKAALSIGRQLAEYPLLAPVEIQPRSGLLEDVWR